MFAILLMIILIRSQIYYREELSTLTSDENHMVLNPEKGYFLIINKDIAILIC